jgi:hypothetical protein
VSLRHRALLATLPLALAALSPRSVPAATGVESGALAHCAAITAADERLACYDTLARPKPSPAAAAAKPVPPSAKASAQAATASGATSTAATAATSAPATAAAGTAAAGATAAGTATSGTPAGSPKSFGLTKHPAPTEEEGPDHIQARVTRVDANRLGNVRLSLDNGQAWTYTDPDVLIRVGDAVTIRRGALGSFLLTTPTHHTYKAQRSQ